MSVIENWTVMHGKAKQSNSTCRSFLFTDLKGSSCVTLQLILQYMMCNSFINLLSPFHLSSPTSMRYGWRERSWHPFVSHICEMKEGSTCSDQCLFQPAADADGTTKE